MFCFQHISAQENPKYHFKAAKSFFPDQKNLSQTSVKFGYLTVPENWQINNGKTIKLAVTVISAKKQTSKQVPLVFIQGGPGAGTIGGLEGWLNHPAHETRDIVLLDLRGTGFSKPSLAPELGRQFLDVLAANYNAETEIAKRIKLVLDSEDELVKKGVDISSYNSVSIASDLHALKIALGYTTWNVYGVSYGTYVALNYVSIHPDDVENLILDSVVPPDGGYYENNTSNYSRALNLLFVRVKNDPITNRRFPGLEKMYYSTLKQLEKTPIAVDVPKDIIPTGKFYFNDQDMMIAVQQSLYSRKLIQVLPLMIEAFNAKNRSVLKVLIKSLASRLTLDYGTYYCMLCNEMLPFNSLEAFRADVKKNKKLNKGLAFYEAELLLCKKWNERYHLHPHQNFVGTINKKTLIIAGEYDPITPPANGLLIKNRFPNSYFIEVGGFGHGPGASDSGKRVIANFLERPDLKPDTGYFSKFKKTNFENDVILNSGVSNIAQEINSPDFIKIAPFLLSMIALFCFLISVFAKWFTRNKSKSPIMNALLSGSTIIFFLIVGGLSIAISQALQGNFYILAFGLPAKFDFVLIMARILEIITIVTTIYYIAKIKTIVSWNVPVIIIALIIINIYLISCGFTTF